MKNWFNIIVIYYINYYVFFNFILQILFIYSLFNITNLFEKKLEANMMNYREEIIKEQYDKLLYLFTKNQETIRYYGMLRVQILDKTLILRTQFYLDYTSNEQEISAFLQTIDWPAVLLKYDNSTDISKYIFKEYSKHIQIIEKQQNYLLWAGKSLEKIKEVAISDLHKDLSSPRRNYIESLNLLKDLDWAIYIRTYDYQTNNMQILRNIYQNVIINIRPNAYYLFKYYLQATIVPHKLYKAFRNMLALRACIDTYKYTANYYDIFCQLWQNERKLRLIKMIYKTLFHENLTYAQLMKLFADIFKK